MRIMGWAVVAGALVGSSGCCLFKQSRHETASKLGSVPAAAVVAEVANAILGKSVTDALKDRRLKITEVKIALQLEDDQAGDEKIAVLATEEGTLTRSTAKTLTITFDAAEKKEIKEHVLSTLGFDEHTQFKSDDLTAAVIAATDSVRVGQALMNALDLKKPSFEYEVDFSIKRDLSGGFDITVGSVGLTANETWTHLTGNQVTIDFEPM